MFAVPLAAAGCMLNFSGGWLQPGLIPVAWFFLVRGLLSTSVLGMYYVSHKAAVTEVFVLEKERVEAEAQNGSFRTLSKNLIANANSGSIALTGLFSTLRQIVSHLVSPYLSTHG